MRQTTSEQHKIAPAIANNQVQKTPEAPNSFEVLKDEKLNTDAQNKGNSSEKQKIKESVKDLKDKKKEQAKRFMRMWFDEYFKLVTAFVCIFLIILSYVFVLSPKVGKAIDLRGDKYENVLQNKEKLQNQLDYLTMAQSDRKGISIEEIENIDLLLPSIPSTPQILTSIESVAKSSNTTLEGIELAILDPNDFLDSDSSVSQLNVPSGVFIVEMSATISNGSYDDLKKFLSNLEKNIRLMDIVSISYSPMSDSYSITIRAYYLPDNF